MSEKSKGEQLLEVAQAFIKDEKISCVESVWQSDRVIENAYEFIEKICNIVGYHKEA